MATRRKNSALGPLRTLYNVGAIGSLTDGQLLERFAAGGEAAELAFAALLERHGALVLQTCRSILRDEHEAEDAFQATFLVLVRKSGSLWVRESLSPWLHQVACRAARCARSSAVRRMAHEQRAATTISHHYDHPKAGDGVYDLDGELHEEIERLPSRNRAAVVLCDLEGRTHEQAARQLGCPVGTVKSRLARGRARLRDRLKRRGLIAPAGLVGSGFVPRTTGAAPFASGVDSTIRAALQLAAGRPLPGAVSPAVRSVIEAVSRGLFMNRLKHGALAVMTLGALAAGAAGLARSAFDEPPGAQQNRSSSQASLPAAGEQVPQNAERAPEASHTADIRGTWEVLYVAGIVAGKPEGYAMPGLTLPITSKSINLLTLTGKQEDPLNYKGAMSYTQDPGLQELAQQVEAARQQLESARDVFNRMEQGVRKKVFPETSLIGAKTLLNLAEKALHDAERRRAERQAAEISDESRIDIEAGPGKEKVLRGIYQRKDEILTICYGQADRGRPESFAVSKPSGCLIILRRQSDLATGVESIPSSTDPAVETSR